MKYRIMCEWQTGEHSGQVYEFNAGPMTQEYGEWLIADTEPLYPGLSLWLEPTEEEAQEAAR